MVRMAVGSCGDPLPAAVVGGDEAMSRYLVDTAPILGAGIGHPDTELIRLYPILGRGFSARRTGRYQIAEGGKVQHWCELGPHGNGGEGRPRGHIADIGGWKRRKAEAEE